MQLEKNHLIKKWGMVFLDIFSVIVSFLIALNIRFDDNWNPYSSTTIIQFILIFVIFVLVYNYVYSNNKKLFKRNWVIELKLVIVYNIYLIVGLIVTMYMLHRSSELSRLVVGYFGIISAILMFTFRQLVKLILSKYYTNSSTLTSVLMVIEEGLKDETIKNFDVGLTFRVNGVLVVKGNEISGEVNESPVQTTVDELAKEIVTMQLDEVLLNVPHMNDETVKEIIGEFEDMGANCYYVLNVPAAFSNNANLSRFGQILVASYTSNERNPWKLALKRMFDIVVSIVGLVFCCIIGIFLVPAIKLESPGPAIFSQIRIGKNGRRFKFYKFRSMYADAEERKKELESKNQMDGLMFKMEDDPRITKVGKFIRKTSLDEFPQFWNVLIGDMSIIGTRPPTEDEFKKYNPHYKRRLAMTPGITGLWQVSGRSEITDFDEIVKLDLEYIDNWSLTLDIEIFFKTFSAVLKRKGAE